MQFPVGSQPEVAFPVFRKTLFPPMQAELFFLIIAALITASYSFIIISFAIGWWHLPEFHQPQKMPQTRLSVIVAARNEAQHIGALLQSLASQTYDKKHYEVIIVNDHSTDFTAQIVLEHQQRLSNLHLLNAPPEQNGKKSAIEQGIAQATGHLLVTTDADCIAPRRWLETIAAMYEQQQPDMIIAPVVMQSESYFEHLQALEFMSLIASTAGAAALQQPIMCNGANLAYTKTAFQQFGNALKNKLASGDDMFLMLKMKKARRKIVFLKSRNATVSTRPQPNWHSFVAQRRRWTSKSRAYRDFGVVLTAINVLAMNLLVLLMLFFILSQWWSIAVVVLILKGVADGILLRQATLFFRKSQLLRYFIPLFLPYSLYVVVTAAISFAGQYTWKNRRLK